jgi:hypothetical protein
MTMWTSAVEILREAMFAYAHATAVITMVVLTKMSAGIGLYWGLSSAAGAVQTLMTTRGRCA